eukprot:TRINITY_DN1285_c0_g1_i1.p1 TRINITY_DN1285_c0_g1~~TRINITY_DN1285_c0_g1_i1.p1  ORF type:complete len:154 (-),score=33.74 TRINITY_DN1285_c0_g1_i1:24-485(-)
MTTDMTSASVDAAKVTQTVQTFREDMKLMGDEIERLEEFSRRDNLRLFGIAQSSDSESFSMCASAVTSALNSVEGSSKTWTDEDIVRAHRVGQARNGGPRPMIAKFKNWKDKMTILTDREFRGKLQKNRIRVSNDLTRRQAGIVAQAKKDGMS